MAAVNVSLDSLDCFDMTSCVLPYHRRVSIRYPCGLAMMTKVSMGKGKGFHRVLGHNISQGGLALLVDHVPEIGTVVQVRMKNRILSFTYDLSARIVHVSPYENGQWLVGLSFSRPLTLPELASLL